MTWATFAACAEMDVESFFPPDRSRALRGLLACSRCPVVPECRADAVSRPAELYVGQVRGGRFWPTRPPRGRPSCRCGTLEGFCDHLAACELPCAACVDVQTWYQAHVEALAG